MRAFLAIGLGLLESVLVLAAMPVFFAKSEDRAFFGSIALAAVLVGIAGFRYSPPGKGKLIFVACALVLPLLIALAWFALAQSNSPF